MHIEGFNIHALEGVIHIARSISFVAVATICIDKTNIVLPGRAICIVLTIRWSMSNAIHITVVQNIATMCASMHITPINMSGDSCAIRIVYSVCCSIIGVMHVDYDKIFLPSIPSIRTVIFDALLWTIRIELPSLNYYSFCLLYTSDAADE